MSTFKRFPFHAKDIVHRVICFSAFLLLTAPAWGSVPLIQPHNGFENVTSLEIGQSLGVTITGAQGVTSYSLNLLDEAGNTVKSVPVTADTSGEVPLTLLWSEQQMVPGCGSTSPLGTYEYQYHVDAEAALSGRTFQIELRTSSGVLAASRSLPIITGSETHTFFTDAGGCPQYEFAATDDVYLTVRRLSNTKTETWTLWLLDTIPSSPSRLQDIRRTYPSGQPLVLSSGVSEQTIPVLDYTPREEECTFGHVQAPQTSSPPPDFNPNSFTSAATSRPASGPAPVNPVPCPPCRF